MEKILSGVSLWWTNQRFLSRSENEVHLIDDADGEIARVEKLADNRYRASYDGWYQGEPEQAEFPDEDWARTWCVAHLINDCPEEIDVVEIYDDLEFI